ncbi:MAG: ribosome biogenesis GTP-binding protein YihA/YsxC [bacterium]
MNPTISAHFIGCSTNPMIPRRLTLPEFIFLGRSNVGKSSLINCLVGQKKFARTSSTPGKTKLFFFYEINEQMLFVDPPGYGYAQVSIAIRNRWIKAMECYLRKSELLAGVILIMDIRHAPTPIDRELADWLAQRQVPTVYILNKADKLSKSKQMQTLARVSAELTYADSKSIIPFSAPQGMGSKELWQVIKSWL